MKKTKTLLNAILWLFAAVVSGAFLWQIKTSASLQHDLNAKKQELNNSESELRQQEVLAAQNQDFSEREEAIKRKVPFNEKQPIDLIRRLTIITAETGLRKSVFSVKEATNQQHAAPAPKTDIKPRLIEITFEGAYPQAVDFLEKLAKMERVVAVEKLSIERVKELLPYQKISLQIVVYSFTADTL